MAAVDDNLFPKLILQEIATDGSDLSNPPADHRTLFLGEDGLLHLRDSAGGVAGVSSGGGGGGGLVLLEQHTAAASASLDFTTFISSTYDEYLFSFVSVLPATSTAQLRMRVGTGGGPTYQTGAVYGFQILRHTFQSSGTGYAGTDSGGTEIGLITAWLSAGSHPIVGTLHLYDPQNTSLFKFVQGDFVYPDSGISNMATCHTAGQYQATTALTAVRFYMSSGNIASGTIRAYGIVKV